MNQTPYTPNENFFGHDADAFAENPEPRVPCILLLDVSTSMQGDPIDQLNDGLELFRDELMADSLAAIGVSGCVVQT